MVPPISRAAIDLIVAEEVSDRRTYERRYRKPEWPQGASGVTIGIGYDVGYASREKLRADWQGRISESMLAELQRAVSVHGSAAAPLARELGSVVDIPWDTAMGVFIDRDVPEWTERVCKALPHADELTPDCLGALVSLAYNRGASFSQAGDRYREMRAIKAHMEAREFDKIPAEFRSMKRLWPGENQRGLPKRRETEARLFEAGLATVKREADGTLRYGDRGFDVESLQKRLTELGYPTGTADGIFGAATRAQVLAFQADRNLPTTGIVDITTQAALREDVKRPVSAGRENATEEDLKAAGSATVTQAGTISTVGKVAGTVAAAKGADELGALDAIKDVTDQIGAIRPVIEGAQDALRFVGQHWWIAVAVVALLVWIYGRKIIAARLADHRNGNNMAR